MREFFHLVYILVEFIGDYILVLVVSFLLRLRFDVRLHITVVLLQFLLFWLFNFHLLAFLVEALFLQHLSDPLILGLFIHFLLLWLELPVFSNLVQVLFILGIQISDTLQ